MFLLAHITHSLSLFLSAFFSLANFNLLLHIFYNLQVTANTNKQTRACIFASSMLQHISWIYLLNIIVIDVKKQIFVCAIHFRYHVKFFKTIFIYKFQCMLAFWCCCCCWASWVGEQKKAAKPSNKTIFVCLCLNNKVYALYALCTHQCTDSSVWNWYH